VRVESAAKKHAAHARVNSQDERGQMNLKQITLITIIGLSVSFLFQIAEIPWQRIFIDFKVLLKAISSGLLYGSLLYFLSHLYKRS